VIDGPLIRPEVSSSDPRDLSGVWYIRLYNPQINSTLGRLPPFTAHGKAEWDARVKAEKDGSPMADASSYCLPHGVPRVMNSPYPIQIIQTTGETVIVHEVAHNIRHIYMDQPHPQTLAPTFMGDSVGHWDGDTLVVETNNLRGAEDSQNDGWVDVNGSPYSEQAKFTEKISRPTYDHLQIDLTLEDPKAYTKPWTVRVDQRLVVDQDLIEFECNENQQFRQHVKGD
jgi:hypothetical protein